MEKSISDRIWVTRYLMVIGIIILHLPPYQPLSQLGDFSFEYIKAFFTHAVFRATVPLLTVISGYLIFSSGLQKKPFKLTKSKLQTLIVPLILWNLPLAVAVFAIQKYGLISHQFSAQLYPFSIVNWINAVLGLFDNPINYPLNFLRDLFVVSILAPVMWPVLRRLPYIGLAAVLCIYYWNLDGSLILRNSMLISFYVGALAATREWDLKKLDPYAVLCLISFISICVIVIGYRIENREIIRLVSPFLLWPAMSLIMDKGIGHILLKYSRNSFFTFLAHGPIILVLYILYSKLLPEAPYQLYWIFAPLVTVILTVFANRYFAKKIPSLHKLFLGGR